MALHFEVLGVSSYVSRSDRGRALDSGLCPKTEELRILGQHFEKSWIKTFVLTKLNFDLIFSDTVDADGEVRSASEGGFGECAVNDTFNNFALVDRSHGAPVHEGHINLAGSYVTFSVGFNGAGALFSRNGELGGIEYLDGTVLDASDNFFNLFSSACSAGRTESGDSNAVFSVTLGNVSGSGKTAACAYVFKEFGVESSPVVGGRGESCGGSGCKHIDVVTDGVADLAGVEKLLGCGRSAGGVSVLTDDNAAVSDESFSSSSFLVDIEPGIGVLYFHNCVFDNGADAEEECSVAGNYFRVVERAYVTDLNMAVSIERIGLSFLGESAVCKEFLNFETCNNTGYITGFVNLGEAVLEIVKSGNACEVTGHGYEGDVREGFSSLYHVGLVTVGVGYDYRAALANKVSSSVETVGVFGGIVLPDDLAVSNTEFLCGTLDTVHVSLGVAFGFVTDKNYTDLEVCGCSAAGCEYGCSCKQHHSCHYKRNNFLEHFLVPPENLHNVVLCVYPNCQGKLPEQIRTKYSSTNCTGGDTVAF